MSSIVTNHIPKVSIIMPAYNTADLIAASLDSVLAQSFQDFEIIVVNDGSPDTPDLERVLAPYLDKIIYINQENKRAAGARNTAIRRARGKFLAFLDSDDQWLPDHLSVQMELFEKDAELDLIYGLLPVRGACNVCEPGPGKVSNSGIHSGRTKGSHRESGIVR
jgi:glycosyltransferase involved in cell wall biosynthesis